MKRQEFIELFKDGFNIDEMASQFTNLTNGQIRPAGRIRELIHQPIEGEVYHYADINAGAVYDFAVKYNIDLDSLDIDAILSKKSSTSRMLEVGTMTSLGEIVEVAKVAGCYVYLIKDKTTGQTIMRQKKEIQ